MDKILCRKEVELMGKTYVAYLKEVPTRIKPGGTAELKTIRAFIKKRSPSPSSRVIWKI